jgi:hypothetical protein
MSVKIKGMDAIQRELGKKLGISKMNKITTAAIKKGGEHMQKEMKVAFNEWADTGASRDEIVISNPRYSQGVKRIKLGWQGSKGRWRLIHLNEFGYTKMGRKMTPAGIGTLRRVVKEQEQAYQKIVAEELRRHL